MVSLSAVISVISEGNTSIFDFQSYIFRCGRQPAKSVGDPSGEGGEKVEKELSMAKKLVKYTQSFWGWNDKIETFPC